MKRIWKWFALLVGWMLCMFLFSSCSLFEQDNLVTPPDDLVVRLPVIAEDQVSIEEAQAQKIVQWNYVPAETVYHSVLDDVALGILDYDLEDLKADTDEPHKLAVIHNASDTELTWQYTNASSGWVYSLYIISENHDGVDRAPFNSKDVYENRSIDVLSRKRAEVIWQSEDGRSILIKSTPEGCTLGITHFYQGNDYLIRSDVSTQMSKQTTNAAVYQMRLLYSLAGLR